jgi:hypothetical protein
LQNEFSEQSLLMKQFLALALLLSATLPGLADHHLENRVYELRTYYANEGKLEALHARFRDHTCAIFEKHGIKNIGYWVPVENKGNKLIYLVSYPSRKAREGSWQAFFQDPAWTSAYKNSIKDGKLVSKVTRQFLKATDYSPKLKIEAQKPERLFELRTYTTNEGKLVDINKRFSDHTCKLFTKHGITNVLYCNHMKDEKGATTTLTYLIAHKGQESRKASFAAFGKDPAWQAVRKASNENGPILVKKGIKSVQLQPVDYSPLK